MKRYSDLTDGEFMSETTDGEYCLHAEAMGEVEQLQRLLRQCKLHAVWDNSREGFEIMHAVKLEAVPDFVEDCIANLEIDAEQLRDERDLYQLAWVRLSTTEQVELRTAAKAAGGNDEGI